MCRITSSEAARPEPNVLSIDDGVPISDKYVSSNFEVRNRVGIHIDEDVPLTRNCDIFPSYWYLSRGPLACIAPNSQKVLFNKGSCIETWRTSTSICSIWPIGSSSWSTSWSSIWIVRQWQRTEVSAPNTLDENYSSLWCFCTVILICDTYVNICLWMALIELTSLAGCWIEWGSTLWQQCWCGGSTRHRYPNFIQFSAIRIVESEDDCWFIHI